MTPLEASLRSGVGLLTELQVGFALIGGLAMATWAEPRVTRDVDLAVAVDSDAQADPPAGSVRLERRAGL